MSCDCVNVEIGSYQNQVLVKDKSGKGICLDRCIADEVQFLWEIGIRTTGSCCGHNKLDGYIGVVEEDIIRMKELNYKVAYNACRPIAEDSFKPKSLTKEERK